MPEGTEIEEIECELMEGRPIPEIFDCYPVGKTQQPVPIDPTADPNDPNTQFDYVMAPAFGTFQWCYMEPIVKMRSVKPMWHFWVSDQSQRTRDNFHEAYEGFTKQLVVATEAERQARANLAVATPEDLKRLEQRAEQMGLGTGPDLLKAMQSGQRQR